ncbi:hypothetical protein BIW11_09400 [Tropilaelaps mercedesae]|uniref:Uncharacterized protein n=1 Tax=Tropilaelaps mercedesae TaxID=418985 RepID=A0A1V9XKQ4_9ACAR|nr:hypothetical protein BIW11_09400 [Tropilaelaps mercedesae]
MAKEKSRRFKYHLAANKSKRKAESSSGVSLPNISSNGHKMDTSFANQDGPASSIPQQPMFNPFAGMKIDPAKLNLNLEVPPPEEWDRKTVVSIHKEVTKGKNKKEKARIKKELLLKKLQATRQLEIDLKERKRREQTVITRDLKPLLDSLPTVDLMFHQASQNTTKAQASKKSNSNKTQKDRNSMKSKQKHKEMMKDMAIFKQVLEDSRFKANPTETMLNHVMLFVQKEHQELIKAKHDRVNSASLSS